MSLIIAAHYESFDQAGVAARQLFDRGFPVADMHTVYVHPPAEHAPYVAGGNQEAAPGANGTGAGSWVGAVLAGVLAALAAALLAASLVVVIAIGAVAAYLGSQAGARTRGAGGLGRNLRASRRPGVLLALRVDPPREAEGARVMRANGGEGLERADGRWSNSRWEDFDPASVA